LPSNKISCYYKRYIRRLNDANNPNVSKEGDRYIERGMKMTITFKDNNIQCRDCGHKNIDKTKCEKCSKELIIIEGDGKKIIIK
jgi:Zn finger protein HypA/HybF involved in hydrogenase expression